MFLQILLTIFAAAYAGVVHDHEQNDNQGYETAHHSDIEHKHATSHQSFKIHHFHAVPVYVKKEDQKYLKHPVEIGGLKHKLKVSNKLNSSRKILIFKNFVVVDSSSRGTACKGLWSNIGEPR